MKPKTYTVDEIFAGMLIWNKEERLYPNSFNFKKDSLGLDTNIDAKNRTDALISYIERGIAEREAFENKIKKYKITIPFQVKPKRKKSK